MNRPGGDWVEGELSEAACRLTDNLNLLIDGEIGKPERALSSREEALALCIIEHIMTAEQLIDVLRGEIE